MGAFIKAIEFHFPENQVTNSDLQRDFPDYDFGKFEDKVGIKTRYWVHEDETAIDLAVKACEKLFKRIDKEYVDYIIYCTQSPEFFLPTSACILQDKLGLRTDIGAFDYNLGCSGYVYGISLAKALIESKQCANVLLVTSETYSKYIHAGDKSNRAIFGDAATATLICDSDEKSLGEFLFGTDGSGAEKLIVRNGAGRNPFDNNACVKSYGSENTYTDNNLYMNGPEIFTFTADYIPKFTRKVLEKNKIDISNVDYFVFHQANAFMLDFLRKRIKADNDKFYIDLANGGNTVSNTIPIAIKRLASTLPIEDNMKVLIVGFGVGLSWAGGLIEINKNI